MKSFIRFLGLIVCLSGWAVVAFCVHVVRVPDPVDTQKSRLIVVPENRINLDDTYVDARGWTMADVKTHPLLVLRLMRAGKADDFKYLADPKSGEDIERQLTDCLSGATSNPTTNSSESTSRLSSRVLIQPAKFFRQ